MGYSDHTDSTGSKNSLRVEQPPSELSSVLSDVTETLLSCRNEQCGGHTCYLVCMDMGAAPGFGLRIL